MSSPPNSPTPAKAYDPTLKQKAFDKLSKIPIKVQAQEVLKKPDWIRVKAASPNSRFYEIKDILRKKSTGDRLRGGLVPQYWRVLW